MHVIIPNITPMVVPLNFFPFPHYEATSLLSRVVPLLKKKRKNNDLKYNCLFHDIINPQPTPGLLRNYKTYTLFYKQLRSGVRAQVAYPERWIWGLNLLMSCLQNHRYRILWYIYLAKPKKDKCLPQKNQNLPQNALFDKFYTEKMQISHIQK